MVESLLRRAASVVVVVDSGLGRGSLLGEQVLVDVGHHAAARDGGATQQLGQLLIVAHGKLDVARHDAGLLVVPRGVPCKLQDLLMHQRERTDRLAEATQNARIIRLGDAFDSDFY